MPTRRQRKTLQLGRVDAPWPARTRNKSIEFAKINSARRTLPASPAFTCAPACWPAASAALWRLPQHSFSPARPVAASALSRAPALPSAAVVCLAAPRRQRPRRARAFAWLTRRPVEASGRVRHPPLALRGSPSRPTAPRASPRRSCYSAALRPRPREPPARQAPQLSSARISPQLSSARTSPPLSSPRTSPQLPSPPCELPRLRRARPPWPVALPAL